MNRRTAMLLGSLVAALAAAEIVVLSGLLAAERQDDRERYARAISQQRRAAGRAALAQDARTEGGPVRTTFCVHGVDTFVTTVDQALKTQLLDDKQRLDVALLRRLSDMAVRAERYVEQASAGPAMPQRMGRVRGPDASAAEAWQPLAPPQLECDDGEAFAVFRLGGRLGGLEQPDKADKDDKKTSTGPSKTPARPARPKSKSRARQVKKQP